MSIDKLIKLRICHQCVDESYLSSEIINKGVKSQCNYCHDSQNAITLDELADYVEWSFKNYYCRTPAEPDFYEQMLIKDKELEYDWYRSGQPTIETIEEAAGVDNDIAVGLQKILFARHYNHDENIFEAEFDSEAYYMDKPPDISKINYLWEKFRFNLQSSSRYFSRSTTNFLTMIFRNLSDLQPFFDPALIVEAGPDLAMSEFYRARYFETKSELKCAMEAPDVNLGPPPAIRVAGGRMNSRGIPVFYGSSNADTALAEIRPPVGSLALVGKFRLVRRVRLLNLHTQKASGAIGSYFDPKFLDLFRRAIFLQNLATVLSRPVLPVVAESEYLPTQVISDYLENEIDPPLDGILFPSAQARSQQSQQLNENTNVILFNKSSKVKKIVYPDESEIRATFHSVGDNEHCLFTVGVNIPNAKGGVLKEKRKKLSPEIHSFLEDYEVFSESGFEPESDLRCDTLEVDKTSLKVHIIEGVTIGSTSHLVHWSEFSGMGDYIEF